MVVSEKAQSRRPHRPERAKFIQILLLGRAVDAATSHLITCERVVNVSVIRSNRALQVAPSISACTRGARIRAMRAAGSVRSKKWEAGGADTNSRTASTCSSDIDFRLVNSVSLTARSLAKL